MRKTYSITVLKGKDSKGSAHLVIGYAGEPEAPHGYLWLGDADGNCVGWIDERQMNAIVKQWNKLKGKKGKK